MKEEFLHYVWKFQKFSLRKIKTVQGEILKIIRTGEQNHNAGPDFFNAQIYIDSQWWVGNVEIHVRSSDWYVHHHELDKNYDNVILHVVWEHDSEIFRKDNSSVPTLELKCILEDDLILKYQKLFSKKQQWINCENDIMNMDHLVMTNWLDRLFLERLEKRSVLVKKELKASKNHWEALFFCLLCKNFGLKVNGESFYSIAKSVDFSVVKKCSLSSDFGARELEALFFGQAGLLEVDMDDSYFILLQNKYAYLKYKYKLKNETVIFPKFFRLRPPNFPTLRLSQLAMLFHSKQALFSEIISMRNLNEFYKYFIVSANEYWDTHYNFGVDIVKRQKKISKKFIDLLLINTIIPIKFTYAKYHGGDASEEIIKLASEISKEENRIIKRFDPLLPFVKNSLQSQALLQLKNEYCDKNKCLQCVVGNMILKG